MDDRADASADRRLPRLWYLAILAFYLSILCVGAGSRRALTQHEAFAAEPAREMLHGERWIIQTFGGVPRYEKPPTMSWLISASFRAFGETEFAARLPAILCGAGVLLLVMGLATRAFGRQVGIIAGLMQSTMFYVILQARLAEADMPMLAAVTAGMSALAWAWIFNDRDDSPGQSARSESRRQSLLGYVFAICGGLAVLVKGPAGIATMYAGALTFAAVSRSRHVLWWILHPARLGLMLAVGGSWFALAYHADHNILRQWKMEAAYMRGTAVNTQEPFWFYSWNVPMMTLPWVLFAIPLIVGVVRRIVRREPLPILSRFFLAWMLPGFMLLSLSANKHKHYCLPILPPLTLASAAGMAAYLRFQYARTPRLYGMAIAAWTIILGSLIIAVGWLASWPIADVPAALRDVADHPANVVVVLGILTLTGIVVLISEALRRQRLQIATLFLGAGAFVAAFNRYITPVFDNYNAYRDLARTFAASIPAGKTTWFVGLGQSQFAFYLNLPLHRLDRLPASRPAGIEYVVCPAASAPQLEKTFGARPEQLAQGGKPGRHPKPEDQLVLLRFPPAP